MMLTGGRSDVVLEPGYIVYLSEISWGGGIVRITAWANAEAH